MENEPNQEYSRSRRIVTPGEKEAEKAEQREHSDHDEGARAARVRRYFV